MKQLNSLGNSPQKGGFTQSDIIYKDCQPEKETVRSHYLMSKLAGRQDSRGNPRIPSFSDNPAADVGRKFVEDETLQSMGFVNKIDEEEEGEQSVNFEPEFEREQHEDKPDLVTGSKTMFGEREEHKEWTTIDQVIALL